MAVSTVDTRVEYALLGPLAVHRGGRPVDLGAPKQRAVLALLLLHRGRVVSTDRLIDAVWGESPPPSALPSLQAYVSNLRRALRDEADATTPIVRRPPGYVIDLDTDRLDAAAFVADADAATDAAADRDWTAALEHVDRALQRWRGPLLDDLWDRATRPPEAQELEALRTTCRETRVSALLATGAVAPALVEAAALHGEHPLRDDACWLHVIALHRAGRSPEALEVFRAHAARLDDELGMEPGTELRELQVAVLRHDPVLAAWPRPPGWTGSEALHTPAAPAFAPVEAAPAPELLGRARETAAIDAALADVRGGATRWILLTGEAGIGKTRLAEEVSRRVLAAGGREAWARCPEDDGTPAGWPIRQLVRALGEDPDTLFVPPEGADSDSARFAIYERVAALLQRTATPEAPIALVVDDIQWADPVSARCVAYLAGALRHVGVLAVLTLRDGEDRTAAAPVLSALARTEGHRHLAVGPLSDDDVARLADRVAGTPLGDQETGWIAARTAGNPLFVGEYARLDPQERARGDVPLAVTAVVGRRLSGLDEPVLDVLRAAAVIGNRLDVGLLAATTDLDADALADRLDRAADEHVIAATPDGGGYAFSHGLVRDAVLSGIPMVRRQRLHARVARVLEDATDGDAVIRRARHLVAALPLADAAAVVQACRAAALVGEERWASDDAAAWWASAIRALDTLPVTPQRAAERDALLVARVQALARLGHGRTIVDTVDTALLDAAEAGRVETVRLIAGALQRSPGAWPWIAVYGEGPGRLIQRLDGMHELVASDPGARVALLAVRAIGHCGDLDPEPADALSTAALREAEATGDPDVLADALIGRLVSYSGVATHARETVALGARLQGLGHRQAADDDAAVCSLVVMAQIQLADIDGAEATLRRGIAASDRLRLGVTRLQLRWVENQLAQWRGDLDTARTQADLAGRVQAQSEFDYPGSYAMARSGIARIAGVPSGIDPSHWPDPVAWQAAEAALAGDHARTADCVARWLATPQPHIWLTAGHLALVADAAATAGLPDHVPELLHRLEPHAGQIANIGHLAIIDPVDRITGRLHAVLGDMDRARGLIGGALELTERAGGTPFAQRCREALDALP